MTSQIVTAPFSRRYDLVLNAEVHQISDSEAIMDEEMFVSLSEQFGSPIIGQVGGLHYHFKPERAIPSNAVAVPERNHDEPDTLLVQL